MYISTRDNYNKLTASRAIQLGMVPTGGLFVPEAIPSLSIEELVSLQDASYQQLAEKIISLYLTDFSLDEVKDCVEQAYNEKTFSVEEIVPVQQLNSHTHIMELWHGPTAAFKDMALQILPFFLTKSMKKLGTEKEIVILVATSGDTGKAALEGFKNVPGVRIIVFYPYGGVSKVQELQMSTTDGDNTHVIAVQGNFDDCQNAVKEAFGDEYLNEMLNRTGYEFSSANSINWGRLLPQIVYYFWGYLNLVKQQKIKLGEPINFVVPTGNFGNILAGWYASQMGLPVHKLICASNENQVLTQFFQSGSYNRNREFKQTNSPSMDILVSSNLERFLYELTNHDGQKINEWMTQLKEQGIFQVDDTTKETMDSIIHADWASEQETLETIKRTFETTGYTLDTHTAVGLKVYEKYVAQTGDARSTIIDATASPFKFNNSVLEAILGPNAVASKDEFAILERLGQVSGLAIHPGLKDLDKKPVVHSKVCKTNQIQEIIKEILKIK